MCFIGWLCCKAIFLEAVHVVRKPLIPDKKPEFFIFRPNFIALFVYSVFIVRSQNTFYSDYNWLSHHQQN